MNRFMRNRLRRLAQEGGPTVSAEVRAVDRWSGFDRWFVRLSHIAQVGLFAVTVFGLYFTVIPLYQMAALEEQIAKRESELHAAELAVTRTYARLRTYVVKEFVFGAGAQCSGLRDPSEFLQHGEAEVTGPRPAVAAWLTRDVRECLAAELQKSRSVGQLNGTDRAFLEASVRSLAARLEIERPAVVERIKLFSKQALADRTLLPPLGEFDAAAVDICHRLNDPQRCDEPKLELALRVSQGQLRIESAFADEVRSALLSLVSTKWPTTAAVASY